MNTNQFVSISSGLQNLAKIIPLNWGNIQNDATDSQINMFEINSFEELELKITRLSDASKNYLRRRWFLWRCAQCDEHIFCLNPNVVNNPNHRDQTYDIEFNNNPNLRFDIKGTIIPRQFRNDIESVLLNPQILIDFFYQEQSRGVRNNIQNRLFIIHHSYRRQEREMYLRCHWEFKKTVYAEISKIISDKGCVLKFQNAKSHILFLFENTDRSFTYKFV
jgi:hypothetical protein